MACECKKNCGEACACAVNNLKCTDMCLCKNCDNTTPIEDESSDESDHYSDSDNSDYEY